VRIPEAGRYLALVRYEAAYRFQTRFKLQIEQNGKTVLDHDYGWREKPKIWAFHERVTNEAAWSWGAVENVVWEGHDAWVGLQPGRATLRLIAGSQPEPAARRNVDLVMLTTDHQQVKERIDKENYLPLDGMLTQSGDVYLRVRNGGRSALTLRVPKCREHSPYWVHMRRWQPITLEIEPGNTGPSDARSRSLGAVFRLRLEFRGAGSE
jgi:hypothetical protein